jgi:heme/copper-type cytochrome/quinol oxidase subunit 2
MSVTKIRKFSSWTLLITIVITVVVLGLFYFGGSTMVGENKDYTNTGLLLDWTYLIFGVTILAMIVFAVMQFASQFKSSPKDAIMSLGVIVLFALLLFVTYSIGDGTPLKGLNADSQTYNVESWLKITDMWINSTLVLFVLIILAIIAGSVKKVLNK